MGRLIAITSLTASSGTFTTTAATITVKLKMQAAGGGAGGAKGGTSWYKAAAGGNAGSYGEQTVAVSPSTGYPYSVGLGGAGGDNTGSNGSYGGTTSITISAVAYQTIGGQGGQGDTDTAATYLIVPPTPPAVYPACFNITNLCIAGPMGGYGFRMNLIKGISGQGGNAFMGPGGRGISDSQGGGRGVSTGQGYGGGGGGGASIASTGQQGGDGGPGLIIVEEYSGS